MKFAGLISKLLILAAIGALLSSERLLRRSDHSSIKTVTHVMGINALPFMPQPPSQPIIADLSAATSFTSATHQITQAVKAIAWAPKVNWNAPHVLEYHEVKLAPDYSFSPDYFVSTGHIQRLAYQYDPNLHLITVDDGYRSAYDLVWPILQEYKIPAVVSVVNEATRDSGSAQAMENHLSRAELNMLARSGWSIAFHSRDILEHELGYDSMVQILLTGRVFNSKFKPVEISLDDPRAEQYLNDLVENGGYTSGPLLARLRTDRARVEELMQQGKSSKEATLEVMTQIFFEARLRLAELADIPLSLVDTFVYPHSQSGWLIQQATAQAGFSRGYAGGKVGSNESNYNQSRLWINDRDEIPQWYGYGY